MNEELKSCPFCGRKPKLYETDHGDIKSAMIECGLCHATIESDSRNQKTATKRATTRWNHRTDGWIKIDPSDASTLPEEEGYYFCHLNGNELLCQPKDEDIFEAVQARLSDLHA
jgi:Lar family restriction alleviation protein